MNDETIRQLDALNRRFYEGASAEAFSASRDHPWPGWRRVLAHLPKGLAAQRGEPVRVLDVGCGNGRFARFLAEEWGTAVEYVGVDRSSALLDIARVACGELPFRRLEWVQGDAVGHGTEGALPDGPFDLIVAFGLLHHVAGRRRRRGLLEALVARLRAGGLLAVTAWRFADSERLARRIVPWPSYGEEETSPQAIDPAELEPGDHLLRFGEGREALRYCHHCDEAELRALTADLDAVSVDRFDEDGSSRDLNRYEVLRRSASTGRR